MRRKLWAEEIALAMESRGKYGMGKLTAANIGVTYRHMVKAIKKAGRDGFAAYPPRPSAITTGAAHE